MDQLDTMLKLLRDEDVPSGLAGINVAVMNGLGVRQERNLSRRGLLLAAGIAASFGLTFGMDRWSQPEPEPLLAMPDTAPSHLLNG